MAGEPLDRVPDEEVPIVLPHLRDAVVRAAIRSMDEVNPRALFEKRAAVMKAVPRFLRGPFRSALKLALEEATRSLDEVDQERGWKLLNMLPRMLLNKVGSGAIPRSILIARFEAFARGDWIQLVAASDACDDSVASARRRSGRRQPRDDIALRATRVELLVQLGELLSAWQALEGAALAQARMRPSQC